VAVHVVNCAVLVLLDTYPTPPPVYSLTQLDHPNVIKLYEYFYDGEAIKESSNIYLVMEECEGGELFDNLHAQHGSHYDERRAAHIIHMMLGAVSYIHGKGVSHRDLKYVGGEWDGKGWNDVS
jgi:serine/threonine protein kinase